MRISLKKLPGRLFLFTVLNKNFELSFYISTFILYNIFFYKCFRKLDKGFISLTVKLHINDLNYVKIN